MADIYAEQEIIQEMMEALEYMEHDRTRLDALQDVIDRADQAGLVLWQVRARWTYVQEVSIYGDALKAYIVYPKLLRITDDYQEKNGKMPDQLEVLWCYKFLTENAVAFYQVSRQEFCKLTEDMKRRYQSAGYSLRAVYQKCFEFYDGIDDKLAEEYYTLFLRETRDGISDCHACERSAEVKYLLARGKVDAAVRKAEPVVSGRLTCAEQPELTYMHFVRDQVFRTLAGKPGNAFAEEHLSEYVDYVRRAMKREHILENEAGVMLMYDCLYEPNKALPWIKAHCDYTETFRQPYAVFAFALGMLLFLRGIREKNGAKRSDYRMKMDRRFRFYREDGVYNIRELYDYYDGLAKEIAQKFAENQDRQGCMELYHHVISYGGEFS